ncbi:MAG: hypothetical protein EBT17_04140 [Actinobacteria bacterium]|nr:hypothetical protein [Actinomycetota bacterium]
MLEFQIVNFIINIFTNYLINVIVTSYLIENFTNIFIRKILIIAVLIYLAESICPNKYISRTENKYSNTGIFTISCNQVINSLFQVSKISIHNQKRMMG